MKKFIFILLILFSEPVIADVVINEIMYDSPGSDNDREFIEVYSDNMQNITGWVIADSESSDKLTLLRWVNSNFSLIAEEGFDHSGINASVYSAGTTIGNNLNNDGDSIFLYDKNGSLAASASYEGVYAAGNGKSLEFYNGSWLESVEDGGTPGRANSVLFVMNSTNGANASNQTNSSQNETGGSICNVSIGIKTEKELYENEEPIKFEFGLSSPSINFTIEYWVEDLQGVVAKSRLNTTNLNEKSWTPRIEESDKTFLIRALLHLGCNNSGQDAAYKIVTVKSNQSVQTSSSIRIEEIYLGEDNEVKFGEIFRVRLSIYRGDSSKSAVELWVEDKDEEKISQISSTTVYEKFMEYELTLPIQLKTNCRGEFPDGKYKVVVNGLDLEQHAEVNIAGLTSSMCDASQETKSTAVDKTQTPQNEAMPEYGIIESPSEITPGMEFETKVRISNEDAASHDFTLWSYVYKGSKCYSGDREGNKQKISLSPYESRIVELSNIFMYAQGGEYSLKVKIIKDSQKTEHELTRSMIVVSNYSDYSNSTRLTEVESPAPAPNPMMNKTKSVESPDLSEMGLAYESNSSKIKKMIIYFLLAMLTLTTLILAWKG